MSDNGDQHRPEAARGYLILIGSLLLVICAALAVLWMTERSRRIRAEMRVMKMRKTLQMQQTLRALIGPRAAGEPDPATRPGGR